MPVLQIRLPSWVSDIVVACLVLPVAGFALLSGLGLTRLPYELWLLSERLPTIFSVHMIASGLALAAIPVVIRLRGRPDLHRTLGRLAILLVLIGGLTSIPVALASEAGFIARFGFVVQGVVWAGLLIAGYISIRQHRIARHATLMLAMAAVASGAIWLRIVTIAAVLFDLPFETTYGAAAWGSWLLPLSVVAAVRRKNMRRDMLGRKT